MADLLRKPFGAHGKVHQITQVAALPNRLSDAVRPVRQIGRRG